MILNTPLRHDKRSLTVRGRAKCPRRRARSFDEGVTVSRPNADGRDGNVNLSALSKHFSLLSNADSWGPKIVAANHCGGDWSAIAAVLCLAFPVRTCDNRIERDNLFQLVSYASA